MISMLDVAMASGLIAIVNLQMQGIMKGHKEPKNIR